MLKSLPVLEKDAQDILADEVTVVMAKDLLNKLKEVFDSCKERGKEEIDEVETADFIASIDEDPSLSKKLDQVVRTSVDNVGETLEELLHRVLKTHKAEGQIKWNAFLGYFTKRGQLRDGEKISLQLSSQAAAKDMDEDSEEALEEDEDWEAKQYRLGRELKQKLISKQNKVPKTGKGKYNVTVPVPFEFANAEKGFSIRGKKVEKMVADKRKQEEKALAFVYKAREVPRHVKEDKFARLT